MGVYDVGADFGRCFACVFVYFEVWDADEAEEVASAEEDVDEQEIRLKAKLYHIDILCNIRLKNIEYSEAPRIGNSVMAE